MSWLERLVDGVFPEAAGLAVAEPNPIQLHDLPDASRFFRALREISEPGALLYWEGKADRALRSWLRERTLEPPPKLSIGVVPVADFYHVPLDSSTLTALAERVATGTPPARVRMHVHIEGRMLVEWRGAFRHGPLLVSRRIPTERLQPFLAALGTAP